MGFFSVHHLDVFTDDLTVDCKHQKASVVAQQAYSTFRKLRDAVCEAGLPLSVDKSCFICSSPQSKKELAAWIEVGDPPINDHVRDLGVDCGGGVRRRVSTCQRFRKGSSRKNKLDRLSVPDQKARIRIFKGSIVSSSLYGHQAMGVPPERMKIIRGMCAGLLGRKSLRGLNPTDPRATIMSQHFQVIHKFFVSAKDEEPQLLHDAWQASWNSLSYREHPWRTVRGPFAACQAYILELGGRAPQVSQWTFPEGVFHFLTPSGYHQVLELMRLKCRAARCTGIARVRDA